MVTVTVTVTALVTVAVTVTVLGVRRPAQGGGRACEAETVLPVLSRPARPALPPACVKLCQTFAPPPV